MAKQPIDIGAKFTGDAKGFEKAAAQVKGSAQSMKKDIKETAGIFDELGSAIGGMGGEMISTFSSIATAATGIGAIVLIVQSLASAWKTSQENIDLYMKSADKLKAGSGGFTLDAQAALTDTKKRAKGQVTAGYQQEQKYYAKAFGAQRFLYTDEEKEYFKTLIAEGQQMQKNGRILLDSVRGIHDKTTWQEKYSKLLKEEEELHDRVNGIDKVRWEGLEAELANQRLISRTSNDAKAVDEAKNKAYTLALQLQTEKLGVLDEQLNSINTIAEMTQTQEVVEDRVFELEQKRKETIKEYALDLLKINRFLKDGAKITAEQLKDQKEFYSTTSEGYNVKKTPASTSNIGLKYTPLGFKNMNIQKYGGLTFGELKSMIEGNKLQESLEGVQAIVGNLESAFTSMFVSISSGSKTAFQDMAKAFGRSLQMMLAEMAGKAVIFGILSLLSGGTGGLGKLASGILDGRSLGKFMGFAGGTNFAPGGLAMVGERGPELVNLPRGSQVIPNGGGRLKLDLRGKFDGRDIYFAVENYAYTLDRNT